MELIVRFLMLNLALLKLDGSHYWERPDVCWKASMIIGPKFLGSGNVKSKWAFVREIHFRFHGKRTESLLD